MNEETELNLEKPIFVVYINVNGLGRLKAEEKIKGFMDAYMKNINSIIFPVDGAQETRMEVLWRGNSIESQIINSDRYKIVKDKLNIVLKLIEDGLGDEVIRQKVRDMQLKDILD